MFNFYTVLIVCKESRLKVKGILRYLIRILFFLFINFLLLPLIAVSGIEEFLLITLRIQTQLEGFHWPVVSRVQGPPQKTSLDKKMEKNIMEHGNKYPYLPWNNSQLEKTLTTPRLLVNRQQYHYWTKRPLIIPYYFKPLKYYVSRFM